MDIFELLDKLAVIPGPSGREQAVSAVIAELAHPYVDEISTDSLGNLIAHKRGSGPRLMLAAHMDTIGLVATYIEESGMVRVDQLGSIQPTEIRSSVVRFENGTLGTVKVDGSADEKELSMRDLYLDIGAATREEALRLVQLGDTAVFTVKPQLVGQRIMGSGLDNRISCVILLKAMEELKNSTADLYFTFTVQEEVGNRGAKTAAFNILPDYAVVVEATEVLDWPGVKKITNAVLGGGAAIKVMDKSIICHPSVVAKLTELAEAGEIEYQKQVTGVPGTDAGAIHQSCSGVKTGVISVPCRYHHTPTEIIQLSDAEACVRLTVSIAGCKL